MGQENGGMFKKGRKVSFVKTPESPSDIMKVVESIPSETGGRSNAMLAVLMTWNYAMQSNTDQQPEEVSDGGA
jgi:hypothetical protein